MSASIEEAVADTASSYDKTAKQYDAAVTPLHSKMAYPMLVDLLENASGPLEGKRVLDAGCGSGSLMELFEAKQATCVGIDVSQTFVEMAREKGLDVHRNSVHDTDFDDESFDAIVSNFAINYLPPEGQKRAFKEQYRLLRPGGVMVFSCMHPFVMRIGTDNYFEPKRIMEREEFGERFVLYLFSEIELQKMLYDAGLSRVSLHDDTGVLDKLPTLVAGAQNTPLAPILESFQKIPYALFVVADRQ